MAHNSCFVRNSFIDSASSTYIMQDSYTKRAKDLGYRARSVFKLKDIIRKYKFVNRGDSVLDLGASPGSWMQYLSNFVKYVLGIDISDVKPIPDTVFLKKDVFDEDIIEVLSTYKKKFDVIVSDMAPNTTGIAGFDQVKSLELCERAYFIAQNMLKMNGNFLCKIFQSSEGDDFFRKLKKDFKFVKTSKPEGSKRRSKEVFYVCMGFRSA